MKRTSLPLQRRRDYITLLGGAAAEPLAARAQQSAHLPTIGYLGADTPETSTANTAAFLQRLHELGWVEERTVAIDYRWGAGRSERFSEFANELVRRKVDIIVTHGNEAVGAAKRATSVIPIVFETAGDPVGTGLVASLARPGGNVTGLSLQQTDLAGKRVELLHQVLPDLRRMAIMANVGNPAAAAEMGEAHAAARALGLDVVTLELRRSEDIAPAFDALMGRADALYVVGEPLAASNRIRINSFALAARLPTIFTSQDSVQAGGLMSYAPNFPDLYRRAADYVDKILRGAKPSDLPVEQPTKFQLMINLSTAKAIGLTIPEAFLARADELIE
jgi:putative ABC transport system substrate-binding protein